MKVLFSVSQLKHEDRAEHIEAFLANKLFSHEVIDDARNSDGGQEEILLHRNRYQNTKMFLF